MLLVSIVILHYPIIFPHSIIIPHVKLILQEEQKCAHLHQQWPALNVLAGDPTTQVHVEGNRA